MQEEKYTLNTLPNKLRQICTENRHDIFIDGSIIANSVDNINDVVGLIRTKSTNWYKEYEHCVGSGDHTDEEIGNEIFYISLIMFHIS